MASIQRRLSDYLQCELYHSLGAYHVAEERLAGLSQQIKVELDRRESPDDSEVRSESNVLWDLVEMARRYNHKLGWHRYASLPQKRAKAEDVNDRGSSWPTRDPMPDSLVLTKIGRFQVKQRDPSIEAHRDSPWESESDWIRVPKFYTEASRTLNALRLRRPDSAGSDDEDQYHFGCSLIAQRDGISIRDEDRIVEARIKRRLNRYKNRLTEANRILGHGPRTSPDSDPPDSDSPGGPTDTCADFIAEIVGEDLTSGHDSLPMFVLRAQAEAHLGMHAVEAWRSMCIGERAEVMKEGEKYWLDHELERSITLSTFAFCVSRTAPWIFAKDEAERRSILADPAGAWENVVPIRCMWIAAQLSLLALHRRAYARALQGKPEEAYNDYHKLQRLIRDTERRVKAAPLHGEGALEFLAGLHAEAHHHIGELYRSAHAYKPALEHFEAATHRLDQLRKDETVNEVLANSRWYVELKISHGKACYEMGLQKEALCWHLQAWRAFLELLASETEAETNTEALEEAIEWLEDVKFEPELRKSDISERIRPVIDQLDRINTVGRVGALGAEILLRLGHLLFVLNLGAFSKTNVDRPQDRPASERAARERVQRTLALACLRKASECDRHSTLIGADLLKARFRFNSWFDGEVDEEYKELLKLPPLRPVKEHWPHGGDNYEQLARVAEYLMLKARVKRFEERGSKSDRGPETNALLARDLLLNLSMSTDSINVRKSQIHRFLTAPEAANRLPDRHGEPAIEFICMRRFSSPFPLLPRPSAFRALGGGYMVRLHGTAKGAKPFGVVIDPGVDFVENLYRTGYSLSDIQMIVLTHDHVDHIGALDPLLSLLHVRKQILKKEAAQHQPMPQLKVLMSRSVFQRYDQVAQLHNPSEPSEGEVEFVFFDAVRDSSGALGRDGAAFADIGWPSEFEILMIRSEFDPGIDDQLDSLGDEERERARREHRASVPEAMRGHRDLSDLPSFGICFRTTDGDGPSLAITSDTPHPPTPDERQRLALWRKTWQPALRADVLVAHLGSVPITELRRMDRVSGGIDAGTARDAFVDAANGETLDQEREELVAVQKELEASDRDDSLKGQVEYAQWLRSHLPFGEKGDAGSSERQASLVEPVPPGWLPPPDHNFLLGILTWAREYKRTRARIGKGGRGDRPGLFVIGELSEELGSMRGKVAQRLNDRIFQVEAKAKRYPEGFPCSLTSDVGLHVHVSREKSSDGKHTEPKVEVLCTTCNLDMDRAPEERYHCSHDTFEVCVKGENEGIFYNCEEHDPAQRQHPAFLEKLERFDIFGR